MVSVPVTEALSEGRNADLSEGADTLEPAGNDPLVIILEGARPWCQADDANLDVGRELVPLGSEKGHLISLNIANAV